MPLHKSSTLWSKELRLGKQRSDTQCQNVSDAVYHKMSIYYIMIIVQTFPLVYWTLVTGCDEATWLSVLTFAPCALLQKYVSPEQAPWRFFWRGRCQTHTPTTHLCIAQCACLLLTKCHFLDALITGKVLPAVKLIVTIGAQQWQSLATPAMVIF